MPTPKTGDTTCAALSWSGAGPFLYTLNMVDVATGWARLRDKRQETIFHAV